MWLQYIFYLAVGCLGLMYLIQITKWTLPSFRQGIIVRRYQQSFSGKIPKKLLNKEILCENVIFKFDTPSTGLFRTRPRSSLFRTGYFPSLLGEINLTNKGIAQITLRISFSKTLILLALYFAIFNFIFNTERVFPINSTLNRVGILLLVGFFSILGFTMEKDDLLEGINIFIERAKSNSL